MNYTREQYRDTARALYGHEGELEIDDNATCSSLTFGPYETLADIKRANHESGGNFFKADTMRFFRSQLHGPVHEGGVFITSEQFDDGHPRLYTVRRALPDGSIESLSEFQQFKSLDEAQEFAEEVARRAWPLG